jgi:hypothetical protein
LLLLLLLLLLLPLPQTLLLLLLHSQHGRSALAACFTAAAEWWCCCVAVLIRCHQCVSVACGPLVVCLWPPGHSNHTAQPGHQAHISMPYYVLAARVQTYSLSTSLKLVLRCRVGRHPVKGRSLVTDACIGSRSYLCSTHKPAFKYIDGVAHNTSACTWNAWGLLPQAIWQSLEASIKQPLATSDDGSPAWAQPSQWNAQLE